MKENKKKKKSNFLHIFCRKERKKIKIKVTYIFIVVKKGTKNNKEKETKFTYF